MKKGSLPKDMHVPEINLTSYRNDGYAVLPGIFEARECNSFVESMMDLHRGQRRLEEFQPRGCDDWRRTHNQHCYDEIALRWLIDFRLYKPLKTMMGDEPEGIQTMYFWKGSEQRRHQDQYYLPGCISAWIALQDASEDNGAIRVQPGSHSGRLISKADFEGSEAEFEGWDYNDAVDKLFEKNEKPEMSIVAAQGDVIFFHGVLIHGGGPIIKKGQFRHSLACHYIPYGFSEWPLSWERISFDGGRRIHTAS